jgi:hypothetical protein
MKINVEKGWILVLEYNKEITLSSHPASTDLRWSVYAQLSV